MRILILGAGAIGGYFGAHLVRSGANVTFLVQERRAAQLRRDGLVLESPLGGVRAPVTPVTDAASLPSQDIVLLTCKAYGLPEAMEAIAPAIGASTAILPLLNGLAHLDSIQARFPGAVVWGGLAHLAVTLGEDGVIRHLNTLNSLRFGPLGGATDSRAGALAGLFPAAGVKAQVSAKIEQDLWEKFVFLATLAGMTCLMRASVGTILATPGGEGLMLQLLAECTAIAWASGFRPRAEQLEVYRENLTQRGASLKASMLRDIEHGGTTEGEHILGDMLARALQQRIAAPLLEIATAHVRAYELTRQEDRR